MSRNEDNQLEYNNVMNRKSKTITNYSNDFVEFEEFLIEKDLLLELTSVGNSLKDASKYFDEPYKSIISTLHSIYTRYKNHRKKE